MENSFRQGGYIENTNFATLSISVKNIRGYATSNVGITLRRSIVPLIFWCRPIGDHIKSLVSYTRASAIPVNQEQVLGLSITLRSLAWADQSGSLIIYQGEYKVTLDTDAQLTPTFRLTGKVAIIDLLLPKEAEYNCTVMVYPQA